MLEIGLPTDAGGAADLKGFLITIGGAGALAIGYIVALRSATARQSVAPSLGTKRFGLKLLCDHPRGPSSGRSPSSLPSSRWRP